ncbi:MAG TPA: hypothetical protein VJX69_11660 [Terriglobales bacterium]|nr:hypothetical protein [Terriglobales bacterium]
MALAECLSAREGISLSRPGVLFVRKPQAKVLQRGLASIVLTALRESDALLKPLLAAKSKAAFVSLRKKMFNDYANLSFIIANSFSGITVEKRQVATRDGFKLVEHIMHTKGTPRLGCETVREAIFCLDTLRRAQRLVCELQSRGKVPLELKDKDEELSANFTFSALWAHLHLDCVRLIVTKSNHGVEKDVLEVIMDGARSAVMAYSFARQGLELRTKQDTYLVEGGPLDQEDRELLEESYSDYTESESKRDAQA